ncbi:MAG: PQQ-dependent sugar dehydrogenase [Opitutia bacterium]
MASSSLRLLSLLGAALLTGAAGLRAADAVPEDVRFQTETLLTGLPQPMHLEFAPDGRLWFIEYGGALKVYDPKTKRAKLVAEMEIFKSQENGFLAFALDPKFAQNGWIYLIYSPVGFEGQYLSRFQVKDDQLVAGSEKLILKYEEQRLQCCHHGATLKFGPDGCLYFSTGDNTSPFGDSKGYAPLDQRPGKEPWDGQRTSANTNTLVGKVNRIRVHDDATYSIPEGNLFKPGTPKTRPEIFAMGTRNPWRLSIDPKTGYVYWGEVGPDARVDGPRGSRGYDEINQAKKAGNYGYPLFVGNNYAYAEYDYATEKVGALFDPKAPLNKSRNNTGLVELPPAVPAFIYWPYAASEQWPQLGEGGRTACAGPVFYWQESYEQTNGFPKHFDRSLLFWDWQRPFIKWARLYANSDLKGLEAFAPTAFVTANTDEQRKKQQALIDNGAVVIRRPVDATFGPDGCLYLLDYGETWGANPDSALLKISYVRGNLQPVAKLSVSTPAGPAPLKTTLSAKGSRDLDGGKVAYSWKLQPGDRVLGQGEELAVTLPDAGNFNVELTVSDGQGGSVRRSLPVVVGNALPVAKFLSPQDGDFFTPGKPIDYKVSVQDAEDGSSDATAAEFSMRTVVTSAFLPADGKVAAVDPGLSLMRQSDCFNCHAVETQLVGPSFVAIAERYRKQPGAEDLLNKKVRLGGSGVWGQVPMLAHPQHTEDEVAIMLRWMFALEPGKGGPTFTRGLEGQVTAPKEGKPGTLLLEATYTDAGAGAVGQLSCKATVALRHRRIEAETAEITGGKKSGKVVGSTNHGATIKFSGLNLSDTRNIRISASAGGGAKGSQVEVRLDSPTGQLLGTVDIAHTGDWGKLQENRAKLTPATGRHDVYLVLTNPKKGGGLMNVDWVQFDR